MAHIGGIIKRNKRLPKTELKRFEGFPSDPLTNYWPYPRIVNGWWHKLTGSEQKCLDYILRHTWGYKKTADRISLTQFEKGIFNKKKNEWVDRGVGIYRQAIITALKGLEKKGFIEKTKSDGKTNMYRLRIIGENHTGVV